MSPAAIAKTAAGLLVTGIVLALLGLFPPLWILPLAVGGTFTATCFVAGQTCYPRFPSLWVACAIMPLVTTLMAFWVIEEARKIAVSLVVRRYDSQLRTDIVTMLRDRPEDYPAEQAEILREERLLRLDEIMADGHGTEQTYEAAVKARDYLTNQLPRERGFRYRVNQTRLTRQVTEKIQAATGSPKPGPITVPPGGLITVLEDRAGLGARFLRHALFDLWSDREISRRAACDIDEVAWILECRWGEHTCLCQGRHNRRWRRGNAVHGRRRSPASRGSAEAERFVHQTSQLKQWCWTLHLYAVQAHEIRADSRVQKQGHRQAALIAN